MRAAEDAPVLASWRCHCSILTVWVAFALLGVALELRVVITRLRINQSGYDLVEVKHFI